MRILIDECIDERFRNYLPDHECQTARYAGLAGLQHGEFFLAAETARFDVFITADRGIGYQQDLPARNIAVIVLRAIEPVRRSLAARARLSCSHRIHSTGPDHKNRKRRKGCVAAGKITRDPDETF
jgi:hypothetical protein